MTSKSGQSLSSWSRPEAGTDAEKRDRQLDSQKDVTMRNIDAGKHSPLLLYELIIFRTLLQQKPEAHHSSGLFLTVTERMCSSFQV